MLAISLLTTGELVRVRSLVHAGGRARFDLIAIGLESTSGGCDFQSVMDAQWIQKRGTLMDNSDQTIDSGLHCGGNLLLINSGMPFQADPSSH